MDTRRTNDVFGIRVVKKCKNYMHKMINKNALYVALRVVNVKWLSNAKKKNKKLPTGCRYVQEKVIRCPLGRPTVKKM